MKTIFPSWVKKIIRNSKARERYFIKRYGSLKRMHDKDRRFDEKIDADSFKEEMKKLST